MTMALRRCAFASFWLLTAFLPQRECVRRLPSDVDSSSRRVQKDRQVTEIPPDGHTDRSSTNMRDLFVHMPSSPDGHLVQSLPLMMTNGGALPTQHWAGHLPASSSNDKYLFYWLFAPSLVTTKPEEAPIPEADVPLIIWLNGGPACSSMDGLFIENGPIRLQVNPSTGAYEVVPDPHSWHLAPAYTLYIDQPVGTGLSFTTSRMYPRNDREVNADFYYFLQSFFKLHADKFVDAATDTVRRRLYFSGESYAGHYIPSMMNYLLKKKDALVKDNLKNEIIIPVRGAAIGNGWVDPFYQYDGSGFAYGLALIDWSQLVAFREMETQCQAELNLGHYNVPVCFSLIDKIIAESHGSQAPTKASGYDVRLAEQKHDDREFPPGHKVVETYLGGHDMPSGDNGKLSTDVWKEVLEAIHATAATPAGQKYEECTDPPYDALSGNDGLGVVDDVIDILEHADGVELMFFNGVYDIICNHVGNERFLEHLQWSHNKDWVLSDRYAWFADSAAPGQVSGYMKEYKNLKFLKVMNAGHMVPMDVPGVALDMMKLFVHGGSFRKSQQRLNKKDDQESCPLCPKCQARDSKSEIMDDKPSSPEDARTSSKMAPYVISYAWLVAGVAVFAFTIVLFTRRRSHQLLSSQLPPYEVELSHDNYKDEPANGNGVI